MTVQSEVSVTAVDWLTSPLTSFGSFHELVAGSGGRHPIEILAALCRVAQDHGRMAATAARLCREAEGLEAPAPAPQGEGLPLPHPLDFEFRFTDATADALVSAAAAVTLPGEIITLLGVPSVALAALRSTHDRRFAMIAEPNVVGAVLGRMTEGDGRFLTDEQDGQAAAAIIDPPWYPAPLSGLLTAAAAQCRPGAQILMSAPPEGLRPAGAHERAQLLGAARQLGLDLCDNRRGSLHYRSPTFELAAMRAAGVGAWLPEWRAGDLLIFALQGPVPGSLPMPAGPPAFELTVHGVRMRMLAQAPTGAAGELLAVCPGEILPSVSARDPRRAAGNLWTSGNRVFSVDPEMGIRALVTMAQVRNLWPKGLDSEGIDLGNLGSIDGIELLIHQLDDVIVRESLQMTQLVGDAAWAKTVNDARFLNGSSSAFLASLHGRAG